MQGLQNISVSRIQDRCRLYGFRLDSFILSPRVIDCRFRGNTISISYNGLYTAAITGPKLRGFMTRPKLKLMQALLSLLEKYRSYMIAKRPVKWLDLASVNVRFFYNRNRSHHQRTLNQPLKRFKYGKPTFLIVKEEIGRQIPVAIAWSITSANYLVKTEEADSYYIYGLYQGKATPLSWDAPQPHVVIKATPSHNKHHRYYKYIWINNSGSMKNARVMQTLD